MPPTYPPPPNVRVMRPRSEGGLALKTEPHPSSTQEQLRTWHADRENRSFIRAMVPYWKASVYDPDVTFNPFKLCAMVKPLDWLYFFTGWFAWTCDGYDFFTVTVTMPELQAHFKRSTSDISTAITLTLLFRSLGAVTFGILADRFGRKWTLVVNLILIAAFEFSSAFTNTFGAFLACRSLFGIVMGGVWGQAAATALENVPVPARGLLSGIMQGGYVLGYLLAAVANMTMTSIYGWQSVYYCGAAISLLAGVIRALLPESRQYILAREELKAQGLTAKETADVFFTEFKAMLRTNWLRCLWGILLMTGFNTLAHGSQDLYPTYLQETKGMERMLASKATIISNVGAFLGSTFAGYLSQYAGRRLASMLMLIWCAVWIPLWILPSSFSPLTAGGFFVQFGVFGSWGVIPIYLGEVSPPAFRASFAGVTYQLGNMISSAAVKIEAVAGQRFKINVNGTLQPDYATIQGVMIGAVIVWLFLFLIFGPEADGAHFERAKVAFQEGGGIADNTENVHHHHHHAPRGHRHEKHATDHSDTLKIV